MGLIVGSVMGPITSVKNGGTNDDKGKDCNYLGSGDYSPEKAGVGGSTPSLATIIPKDLAELWRLGLGKITHGRSPTLTE